jgi:glycosyltransferase involved in cell wall biosynthesis
MLFQPGNAEELREKIRFAWSNPGRLQWMGHNARAEYKRKYTADANYSQLIDIYTAALGTRSQVPALAAA